MPVGCVAMKINADVVDLVVVLVIPLIYARMAYLGFDQYFTSAMLIVWAIYVLALFLTSGNSETSRNG